MSLPFPSIAAILVFYIVFLLWILSGNAPKSKVHDKVLVKRDKSSAHIIMLGLLVSTGLSFIFSALRVAMLSRSAYYLGIVLMVIGIVVRQWAVATLGTFFTSIVSVQETQRVVQNGPYRTVRHPAYSGAILTLLGLV